MFLLVQIDIQDRNEYEFFMLKSLLLSHSRESFPVSSSDIKCDLQYVRIIRLINFQYHIRCFSNCVVSYANRKMNCAEKRKRKILSIAEKLAILKKFDKRSPVDTLHSFAKLVGLLEISVRKIL